MKIAKATFTKGDDGIFYLLPTLYYDKNWERVCFGLFSTNKVIKIEDNGNSAKE